MGKPTPPEDLVIPPQDSKICGTICLCQLTAVLSSVALVYLTVAVYIPTMRAFSSGISDVPAMCTTTRNGSRDNCSWVTCTEWCLSKSSGPCTQVNVNLRRNGTSLVFANCTNTANKTCYGIDQERANKLECIKDFCKNLTGTFNCTQGTCINITDAFECIFKETDVPMKCSGRRGKITCQHINGLFNCERGTCEKILPPYNCDRRCLGIPTRNKNMILISGDKVYLSRCARSMVLETGVEVWNEDQDNILMASCYTVENMGSGFEAKDCINGSLLEKDVLEDQANFTYLSTLSVVNTVPLDRNRIIAPPEIDLLLHNESNLLINPEGCVNTLADECKAFFREYGQDGSDHNARARFPCFYAEKKMWEVYVRYDLEGTYQHFLIMSIVPSVLFVVSCTMLFTCQRTVEVGDDAKMRFRGFKANNIVLPPGEKAGSLNDLGDGGGNSVMAL